MRVLHVTSEFPPLVHGGLGRHVDGLARAQAAAGLDVQVLAPADDVLGTTLLAAPQHEWCHGVAVHRVGTPPADAGDDLVEVAAAVQRRMVVSAEAVAEVEVVHAHDWMTAEAAHAIASARGVPFVLTLHATEHGRRFGRLDEPVHRAVHAAERSAVACADRVVVCSTAMRAEAVAHGARPDAVHVVPGGVDDDRWRVDPAAAAAARRRWLDGAEHLVVAAGRLEWEKGFSTLLRALPGLGRTRPAVRVVVAGRGSYQPVLTALASDLGVGERITWPGRLATHDLAALFAAADVAVVPSRYEPFGLVALEAQAAGAPVVVTRTGGLADLVTDGVTGRVIEPGDVDHLAEVLSELLGDPARRHRLADAGRTASIARGWPSVAAALLDVYRR
ncbi:MAG: glycosyltransferase family 4 protein [Angustibacter sp.]